MNYSDVLSRARQANACSFRLRNCAGVVVNNAPAFRKALPNQAEDSANVALSSRQMPVAQDQSGIRAEKAKFKAGKIELTHGGAVGIISFVTRQHTIPPAGNSAASGKRELRRMPVTLEKGIDIAMIPSLLLHIENCGDSGVVTLPLVCSGTEGDSEYCYSCQ